MQIDIPTKNVVVLERLLSDFASRLNGSIDFWTAVCLGPTPINRREFIREKSDELRSVLVVLSSVIATSFKEHRLDSTLRAMSVQCKRLTDAFVVLERFDSNGIDELRLATDAIAECYRELQQALVRVITEIGVEPPAALMLSPERLAYFGNVLDGLFDMALRQRRDEVPTPTTGQAGGF